MKAPTPNPEASKGNAFDRLACQMPIFLFRDLTNEDDYIEPLPTNVGGWSKMSRMTSVLGTLAILATCIFFVKEMSISIRLKEALKAVPAITTKAQLLKYQEAMRALQANKIPQRVEQAAVITALADQLAQSKQWEIQQGLKSLEIEFTLEKTNSTEALVSACNQELERLNWIAAQAPSESPTHLKLSYVKK